jgi:FAD/FMN-containing dehydrogenase
MSATSALAGLGDVVLGQVIRPDDPGYDEARRVWNGSIDRRPMAVVRCTGVADVQAAVRFAREHDLLLAVRGGGHNVAGLGTCEGGLVIDLSPMTATRVDPTGRRARAEPGLRWGDLDRHTQAFGLAVPGGIVSTTGVAGFTLGGGVGWLHRPFGLTVDNLVAATVVTADGRLVRATEEAAPDLLWGLRGGGGNFGIVTTFEFRLHPVGPELVAGLVLYRAADLAAVAAGYREIMASAPDELTLMLVLRRAPAAPFLPPSLRGEPVVGLVGCHAGPVAEGARALAPLRDLAEPLFEAMVTRPYRELQSMMDGSWAPGYGNYWKAEYLTGVPDNAIEVLGEHLRDITSPLSDIKVNALGGSTARVPVGATAFAHRAAPFLLNINARWPLPGDEDPHIGWARGLWDAMRPYSAGGGYVNFLGEEGSDRVRAAYGEATFRRLVALKRTYDPANTFRVNQNIPPTP